MSVDTIRKDGVCAQLTMEEYNMVQRMRNNANTRKAYMSGMIYVIDYLSDLRSSTFLERAESEVLQNIIRTMTAEKNRIQEGGSSTYLDPFISK